MQAKAGNKVETMEELKPKINQRPCHICGSSNFEWEYVRLVYDKKSKRVLKSGYTVFAIRRCLRCQNVQLFYDEQTQKEAVTKASWIIAIVLIIFLLGPFILALIAPIIMRVLLQIIQSG